MNNKDKPAAIRSGSRWGALVLMALVIVGAGLAYGHYSQRWGPPADIATAVERLDTLPRQLGNWTAVEDLSMGESAITMLQCAGYANRRYVNSDNNQVLHVAIIVGPPGPIAVHTPEICYSSRAYEIQKSREVAKIDWKSQSHSFWEVEFGSRNALADSLKVMYGWSDGKQWQAANSPRFEFAALPYLYKLQLAAPIARGNRADDFDAGRDFLSELVKVWGKSSK